MPAWLLPAVMAGGSALGSWLSNRKSNKAKTTTTSTTSGSTTPTLAPEYKGIQSALVPMIQNKLANPYKLPAGFEQAGIRDINKTYDLAGQSLSNNMTARGLGRSAIAGAGENALADGRASEIVQYQGTLPLIQRGFQSEDIGQAMALMNMGRGSSTTGTGTSTSDSATGEGSALGSGISSLVRMLGYLRGQGMLGGGTNPTAPGQPGFENF